MAHRSTPSESTGILARKRWSYREDQRLLTLHDRGLSDSEIARTLGRTSSSVQMRRLRLGIKLRRAPRPWSDAEERRLAAAHKKGRPDAVIAQRLDRPVRLLGLVAGAARGWTRREDARLRRLYRGGCRDDKIGQELGCT